MPSSEFRFSVSLRLCLASKAAGTSRYDSLQATLNKRLSHGFQFLAAYTLSRSVDSAQDSLGSAAFGIYGATVFGEQVFNDQNDLAAQRGPSDFDRRHRFVLSGTWQLPRRPVNHTCSASWRRVGNLRSRDAPIRASFQHSRQCRRHALRAGNVTSRPEVWRRERRWRMRFGTVA